MKIQVAVLMGSASDWETMKHTSETLESLGIAHEAKAISAHRTPDLLEQYVKAAEGRGIEVFIAAAGAAAHLAGVIAAKTQLPVLGVPMTSALNGLDSLVSIVQMPAGIPVGTLAIGKAGAINSALLAAAILSLKSNEIKKSLKTFRENQTRNGEQNQDLRPAK